MGMIRGIKILLYEKVEVKNDEFNRPMYEEKPIEVDNVLISPAASTDIIDTLDLTGKKIVYTLAIPKGDIHEWEDKTVEFFGEKFKTVGIPTQGIDELIPGDWNKQVKVERYE